MAKRKPITWISETRKLGELIPWDKNPRVMTEEEEEFLIASIKKFGFVFPLAISPKNHIYDGHQRERVMLAKMDEYTDETEIDVRVSSRMLTKKERGELVARLHSNVGKWDKEKAAEIYDDPKELEEWGAFDLLEEIDWEDEEPPPEPGDEIDKADELRKKWKVELGQIWTLGDHRIIVGDCTDPAVVERLMQGEKADICFTDPPYGINIISGEEGTVGGGTKEYPTRTFNAILGDDVTLDLRHLQIEDVKLIIWGGNYFANKLPISRCWFIWNKKHPVDRTFAGCELAWTNLDRHSKIYECTWDGWTKEGESGSKNHPTQKPIKLFVDILGDIDGDLIIDPFLGSGTTLIACERLNRKCYGVEIEPKYIAVALERWHQLTGEMPELTGGMPEIVNGKEN